MILQAAKMSRIRIIVNKRYAEEAISALHDVGVLQVETLPESVLTVMKPGESQDAKRISDYAQRFRGLESLLYKVQSKERFSFDSINDLTAAADSIHIDERVTGIRKDMDSIDASMKSVHTTLSILDKISGFNADLAVLSSANIVSFVAYGQQLKQFEAAVKGSVTDSVVTALNNATIVSIRKGEEKQFAASAERFKVNLEVMPQLRGHIHANKISLEKELASMSRRKISLDEELAAISEAHYAKVSAIREQLDIEMSRLEIATKLGVTDSVIAIEGWLQTKHVSKLESLIKGVTHNHYILEKIETDELPPTILVNPMGVRLYEFFINFYSLPKSDEVDPTFVFAMVFPIFFGFMIGDAGYGLVMLSGSLWLLHRFSHPPKKSRIPKQVSGFARTIVSENGMRIIAKAILPGAIIAIFLGILFNEWFGFQVPFYKAVFDVQLGLSKLLVVSGWIGVAMVSFGFILGFFNRLAVGEKKHAIAKLGWLAAAWGFVILGLNILYGQPTSPGNPIALLSYVLLVGGVISIFVFEGAKALVELPSLISHILSYTRLVGILLASVILASVVDYVFVRGLSHGLLLGLVGILVLVLGQVFNLVIAVFEPGIQGARLIYVEFFSKFFEGNGRPFRPFTSQRRHTLSKFRLN